MNQLQALTMLTLMHTAPMQPQTYYVANLSENDGANCGSYYMVFPQNQVMPQEDAPITHCVMEEHEGNSEE